MIRAASPTTTNKLQFRFQQVCTNLKDVVWLFISGVCILLSQRPFLLWQSQSHERGYGFQLVFSMSCCVTAFCQRHAFADPAEQAAALLVAGECQPPIEPAVACADGTTDLHTRQLVLLLSCLGTEGPDSCRLLLTAWMRSSRFVGAAPLCTNGAGWSRPPGTCVS